MALAHTPELNYKGIFRRSSIINKNEKIDRPMRSDLHRPGRDAATMWRHEMEEKPLVRSSNSDSKVLVTEEMNFYFEFVLAGDNDVVQFTECCEGHLKEGVLMALIDIVSSMSNVRIKIGQFFLKLSKLDDCRKSIPSFYYIKVSLTAKIYLQYGNGSFKDINILHNNLSEYVHSNKLLTYLLRTGLSINRDVKEVKIKHNGCTIYTEAPSVAPTFITETPSKYKSPKAVSLVFQVALAGKKTAAELSSCCRDQVLSGMRKSLGNVLSGLSGRKLKDKNSEIIFDGSNSIKNEPNNNIDRFLEDNRDNTGPELEEVTIEFFDIGDTPEGDPLVSSKINVLIENDSSNEEDKSQLFNDMRGSFGDEIENGGVAQSIKSEGLAVEASAIQTEHPSDSPTSIPSIHPSDNPSTIPSFSPSKNPSISSNPSKIPSLSTSPSGEPTKIPTYTKFPSFIPSKHPSTSSQPSQIYKPSNNPSISKKPSKLPSGHPSSYPSSTPSQTPSSSSSSSPSLSPSLQPSSLPSYHPSDSPTRLLSILPSVMPTNVPSNHPSIEASGFPSFDPSRVPSLSPSDIPSIRPSISPSEIPSTKPSTFPSYSPSNIPSILPTLLPSKLPSFDPSDNPSLKASFDPSGEPSIGPIELPSFSPSAVPSSSPSLQPSILPSVSPSMIPSDMPSVLPSLYPSIVPSGDPSSSPSSTPSQKPSSFPSSSPSLSSSLQPSYLMYENVAIFGSVTQSSVRNFLLFPPWKAIDGDLHGFIHTNWELYHWLQVTLDQMYPIFEVIVYNRLDCCQYRAIGFVLTIIRDNTIVYNSSESDPLISKSEELLYRYKIDGIEGDTVRIEIHRTELGIMNLAEVEVFALRSNIASTGPSMVHSGDPAYTSSSPSQTPSSSSSSSPSLSPSHWVACGESSNSVDCDGSYRISYDIEAHGIRCCSDVSKDGFTLNDDCNVYAITTINGTCYSELNLKTYTEAVSICQSIQARLCTKEEIGNDCTTNSHCSHEWMIWTSDRFEYPFIAGRVIHALDYDSISAETMLQSKSIVISESNHVTYNQVDFGPKGSTKSIQIRYGKETYGGQIQFRLGGKTGQVIGQFEPVVTRNWRKYVNVGVIIDQGIVGKHDLTITVSNADNWVIMLEWIELSSFDYPLISAIEYKTQQGTQSEGDYITELGSNDYLTYGPINFGLEGTTRSIFIRYAKPSYGGHIEFRRGGPQGLRIGTFNAMETGSWDKYVIVGITVDENVGGIQNLTIVAKNDPNDMKLEWIKLSMLENVARHGSATQSSVYGDYGIYSASKAIDGIRSKEFKSYMLTKSELDHWWQVTLDQLYPIFEVHVYNRLECCQERAIGFVLTIIRDNTIVYNSSESDSSISKSEEFLYRYKFDGIEGDTVRIEIHRTELGFMNLAEVEVFALQSNIASTETVENS